MATSGIHHLFTSIRRGLEQAFPPVMAQLLRELVKPDPDFKDIARVISMDPLMTAAVLNLVNSPFYGLSQQITSLERAAIVLGTKEILKIALSVSYMGHDKRDGDRKSAFANWRIIVWSAIAAELIATRICPEEADTAYLCTLLKDLSLLLVKRAAPEALTDYGHESFVCLGDGQLSEEQDMWGITHCDLTIRAFIEWDIPEIGCGCISHHHDMDGYDSHPSLVQAIILATRWSELLGGCNSDPLEVVRFEMLLKAKLELSSDEVEALRQTCVQKFRSMLAILELEEAEPESRLYEHSVQVMQNYHFQSTEISTVQGGLIGVGRVMARHLKWNFGQFDFELSLRSPHDDVWVLIRSDEDGVREVGVDELDMNLPWTFTKKRYLMLASSEKWGEVRVKSRSLKGDAAQELPLYVRFVSRAYEQYCMRQAVLETKARTLDALPVGVARLDKRGQIQELNQTLSDFLGKSDSTKGRDVIDCLSLVDSPGIDAEWRLFLGNEGKVNFSKVICPLNKSSDTQCLYISAHKERVPGTESILFIAEDVTDLTEFEIKALQHGEFMEQLVESMQDIVMTVDGHGVIEYASPYYADKLLGRNIFEIAKPVGSFDSVWDTSLLEGGEAPVEVILQMRDGNFKSLELIISRLRGSLPEAPSFLVVGRDMTAVRRLEDKLKRQAIYDGLTGLFNHYQFHSLLDREVRRSNRTKRPMGLLFFDLDGFKRVNDIRGHQAGDKVLKEIGLAIRSNIRKGTDFPCRYGGDEFAVIATEATAAGVFSLGKRIKEAVDTMFKGEVALSMGVALLCDGEGAELLLKRADRASYAAKSRGGNCIVEAVED